MEKLECWHGSIAIANYLFFFPAKGSKLAVLYMLYLHISVNSEVFRESWGARVTGILFDSVVVYPIMCCSQNCLALGFFFCGKDWLKKNLTFSVVFFWLSTKLCISYWPFSCFGHLTVVGLSPVERGEQSSDNGQGWDGGKPVGIWGQEEQLSAV